MKTLAIIPAGGAGGRMGNDVPKQYLLLAGAPVIAHTLKAFQRSPAIDEIFLVVPEGDVRTANREIVERHGLDKVTRVLAGGRERADSVRNALMHSRDEHGIIVVHDGVRPFVSARLIRDAVAAAREHGAAAVGVGVTDTVKDVTAQGWVARTLPRERLWLTQTPQAFLRTILLAAYERAGSGGYSGTDDSSLVERMEIPVRMIPGDWDNIKLTTPEDFARAECICRRLSADAAH